MLRISLYWVFYTHDAIPMRMMCPLLHVLPNGLAAEAGNPLLDTGVIVPGMCLSITVSYTHLDVYKRQVESVLSRTYNISRRGGETSVGR